MTKSNTCILTINAGSSSIKFAFYLSNEPLSRLLYGEIDRIGLKDSRLIVNDDKGNIKDTLKVLSSDFLSAVNFLIDWMEKLEEFSSVIAVGHRVVFGMHHTNPEFITQELVEELRRITPYDSDHLPIEIELIEAFRKRCPNILHVACFDTSFHTVMPRVAKLLPIPRRFDVIGIQRYGFHGLSYAYLMKELTKVRSPKIAQGRIILAHLGNGASLAAVHQNKCIDTSMGFTPAGGVMMGTRSGDIDPGVAWYIMQSENLTLEQFNHLINHESGLVGVSETSADIRDLLANERHDVRAAEAIALFCYQIKKNIGAFAAALGGLDTLVFAGGIGENSPAIRARISEGLGFLGIELEEKRNAVNAPIISKDKAQTTVHVIHTDEEWMIAQTTHQMIITT